MVLNIVALWKQEARNPARTAADRAAARVPGRPGARFIAGGRRAAGCWWRSASAPPPSACRTSCSSPMAARSCNLSVGRHHGADRPARRRQPGRLRPGRHALLGRGGDPYRLAGFGARCRPARLRRRAAGGAPWTPPPLFRAGTAADRLRRRPVRGRHADRGHGPRRRRRRAAWRSAPGARCRRPPPASPSRSAASCATSSAASPPRVPWVPALAGPAVGYGAVYHLEIVLLFADPGRDRSARPLRRRAAAAIVVQFRPRRVSRLARLSAEVKQCQLAPSPATST